MLKAIQILCSSSVGFVVANKWIKPHSSCGVYFVSISTKSSSGGSRRRSSMPLLDFSARKARCFRSLRMYATRAESKSDGSGTSSSSSSSVAVQSAGNVWKINFCQWCGGATKHEIPNGEEKMRAICTVCERVAYQNPKMVVGCLIEHDNKILLCKRKIHPSFGLWTFPSGFMEIGESSAEGAVRETWEEACAKVEVLSPFAQLDSPRIGQTYIIFLAKMKEPHFSPGSESSDCQLFALNDIPLDSLAFASTLATINLYIDDVKAGRTRFHYGIINKRPGTTPSDIRAHTLDSHLQS